MEDEVSDIVLFAGRFHPMILHLPIGFLFIAVALEIFSRFKKFQHYKPAIGFVLLLGASSVAITAALGLMLAYSGGYNEELLSVHQWSGIVVVISSAAAFILHWKAQTKPSKMLDKAYLSTLSVMVLALIIAGHVGGSLTHGSGYLTQYMPNSLRTLVGLPAKKNKSKKAILNLNEAVVFTDIVNPILDASCTSCHNESKSKGDLQLHTVKALMDGGESGPILVAGNAEGSEMIRRLHLPENDEEHMPPEGHTQLTDEEIELLTWWINEGASFDKTVSQVQVTDKIQAVLNVLVDPDANKTEVEKLLAAQVAPADGQILMELLSRGVLVTPLSAKVNWLQARVSPNQADDSLMNYLSKISEQLTWLDLGGTSTTDKILSSISQFKNLTRLHLEKTAVTDEGLHHLLDLPYLEYLNLFDTQVSDEGIQQLTGLKNLKHLYVWETLVTKKGATEFQQILSGVEVNIGVERAQVDTVETAGASVKEYRGIAEKKLAEK